MSAATDALALPGLNALTEHATTTAHAGATPHHMALSALGLDPQHTPHAAARARGDGILSDSTLVCADPVHLLFNRDALHLQHASSAGLAPDEAHALIATLNATFADVGRFEYATPERWYLHLAAPVDLATTPIEHVVGRRIDEYLPSSGATRRLLNEFQMCLHQHPVNQAREARGEPAINSLWLWGEGALPQTPETLPPIIANSTRLAGLAQWAGSPWQALPAAFSEASLPDHSLIVADDAFVPWLAKDLGLWREAVVALEKNWFAPLAKAVADRTVSLTLLLPGDAVSLTLRPRRPSFFARFKTPRHFAATLSAWLPT